VGRGSPAETEVFRVVAQEHTEPSWPVIAHPAAGDNPGQGDRRALGPLLGVPAGPVPACVFPGEVAGFQPVDRDRYGVRVVGIVVFRDQEGDDLRAHPLISRQGSGQPPQVLLVVRLTDHLQVLITL
jgi:hypothetical protein